MRKQKSKLEKNRLLNFKMGLIVSLSVVLLSFEWSTFDFAKERKVYDLEERYIVEDEIKQVKLVRPKVKSRTTSLTNIILKTVVPPVAPPSPDPDPKPIPGPVIGEIDPNLGDGDEVYEEPIISLMPASAVEVAPYYLDCKNVLDRKTQADCSYALIREYVQSTANYPRICADAGIQGQVLVEFIVSRTGEITDVKAVRGVHSKLDQEAVNAVKRLPRLEPAQQQGINVPVIYHIPVDFVLKNN